MPPSPPPPRTLWCSLLLCWCAWRLPAAAGKYVEGQLVTAENWAFLARFCFRSEDGTFEYKIEYDKDYAVQNLLLYYDSSRQWPAVYKTNKTCEQKESVLSLAQNQVVNLTEYRPDSGCVLQIVPQLPLARGNVTGGATPAAAAPTRGRKQAPVVRRHILSCHNVRRFRSARERWWFIAVSNCNATKGLNLRYRFLMTNGPPGDYWHEHFSADEFYILPTLMFFTIAYVLMIVAIVMCSVELRSRQLLHTTYKLFVFSVVLQALGVMVQSIACIRYASDGVGFPRTRQLGRLLEAWSETTFLLLLLLLAKGFTVTRARLRVGSSIKLTIFMCLYVVLFVSLFIYEREFFDPGEVLYLFQSPAGYGLMVLRIVAWWMFVYSTVFTLKHYPEKATFYYPFNLLATLWFVAGPCFIMSANSLIDKWVRESIVFAVLHTIAFLGHVHFLVLTRPSKANKNFPFHVRTSQIAVMEVVGVAGASSLYHFGHHAYAPGAPKLSPTAPMAEWVRDVPVGLFTVSRAVADMRPPAVAARQPYPPPSSSSATTQLTSEPATPPKDSDSPISLRPGALTLGVDMAGGEARVRDGRPTPLGSPEPGRDPHDTPRDPHMFIAPSQRPQPRVAAELAEVERNLRQDARGGGVFSDEEVRSVGSGNSFSSDDDDLDLDAPGPSGRHGGQEDPEEPSGEQRSAGVGGSRSSADSARPRGGADKQ